MASVPDWRVLYFDAPTRGEQVRLLFVATGTPFEDVRFKFPGGIKAFQQATMSDDSPLAFDQVPCVEHDGQAIVQTVACMQYVGTQLGLTAGTPAGDSQALSLALGAEEARNAVFYGTLIPVIILKYLMGITLARAVTRWWRRGRYERWMGYFERLLRIRAGPYFVCDKLTYADVAIFDFLQGTLDVGAYTAADLHKDYPLLSVFVTRVRTTTPHLNAYLDKRGPVLKAMGFEK